jgi:hypothetical protein
MLLQLLGLHSSPVTNHGLCNKYEHPTAKKMQALQQWPFFSIYQRRAPPLAILPYNDSKVKGGIL